jgi:hypothetical protein
MQLEFDHDTAVMDAAEGCCATHPGAIVRVQGQRDFVALLGVLLLSSLRSASSATAQQESRRSYHEENSPRSQRSESSLIHCPSRGMVAF